MSKIWGEIKPGDQEMIDRDDPTATVMSAGSILGPNAYVRLPPELGGYTTIVLSSGPSDCAKCQQPTTRHILDADHISVDECLNGCGFVWARGRE